MKKLLIPAIALLCISIVACKGSDKKDKPQTGTETPKSPADSVMAEVMEGHDAGMAKMGKLQSMQKEVERVLDSIAKLPAKAKAKLAPYQAKMEAVLEDLKSARSAMDKWMEEFNMDSATNDMERRLQYLRDENGKVSAVKRNILSSLEKADSLIKSKF